MNEPQWTDGAPANIEAALLDALEWCRVLSKLNVMWRPKYTEDRERLYRCIGFAKRFLPEEDKCQLSD